ncbi:MAG: ATP-dependent 6-phosphofructokinase [Desulfatibacillaceae bacterium]
MTEEPKTDIELLGEPRIATTYRAEVNCSWSSCFTSDEDRILMETKADKVTRTIREGGVPVSFERAGPRAHIYHDPSKVRAALVTCGGLCPGLNDILRAIVLELYYAYGVRNIYGIRYGLAGFIAEKKYDIMELRPDSVANIHEIGGTILGSSRGPQDINEIVDCLERLNVGMLYMIGGDGTLMAATRICDVIKERGLKISVIGVPKTIDNDIFLVSKSFGFDTAVGMATHAIRSAHTEAIGYPNGVGVVKLMGRYSGFIAVTATLAQQDVNFVLIPEVDFDLQGENGLLESLKKRLQARGHAVIVVAEGAGQKFFEGGLGTDPSGNLRLHDIGVFIKEAVSQYLKEQGMDPSVKYIDPSYMIRSLPANSNDNVFCSFLARNAVHAGMAGRTRMLIGYFNDEFVHVPLDATAGKRKQVLPSSKLWHSVLEATGQGDLRDVPRE